MGEKKEQYSQYVIKLCLTQFIGARVMDVENENGDMERCVCIPMDRNNLKKNPKGSVSVYLFMARMLSVNKWGWTHWLKMKLDPIFLKRINNLGIENPFLGNAKMKSYVAFKDAYEAQLVKAKDYE